MSALAVIGPQEAKLVEESEALVKRQIHAYFQAHWLGSSEQIVLAEFIDGMTKSEATFAGVASTPFLLDREFSLLPRDNPSLLALHQWVLNLIAKLGESHSLSKLFKSTVMPTIEGSRSSIDLEHRKLLAQAASEAEGVRAMALQFETTRSSLMRQLALAEERVESVSSEKEAVITALRADIVQRDEQLSHLSAAANGQAQSMRQLTAMASLDDAAHITVQLFQAVEATLDQLSQLDVAAQAVRQHKSSAVRELMAAKEALENVRNPDWVSTQVTAALSHQHRQAQMIATFVHEGSMRKCASLMQSQVKLCGDVIDDAVSELSRYRSYVEDQRFKKVRLGYKEKLPAIEKLIGKLRANKAAVKADGTNARQILLKVQRKIEAQKTTLYNDGKHFKQCIDAALEKVERGLDGRVTDAVVVTADSHIDPSLIQGVDSATALSERLAAETRLSLIGPQGIQVAIAAETSRAVTCLERASVAMDAMGEAVERAASVRARFVSSMEQSFAERRELPAGIEGVTTAMQTARDTGALIRDRLRGSHPAVRGHLALPAARASAPPAESLVVSTMAARRRTRSIGSSDELRKAQG